MTNAKIASIVPGRERDLGGLVVRRILPAIGRKMVGPFVFLDHMGPAAFAPGEGIDVRPHPHIGLATVTFLFEGAIMHRDSLGSEQVIRPGDVNWMTAGSGIVHSERTPAELRKTGGKLDGMQSWIALPKAHEEVEASFYHHPGRTLPKFEVDGVSLQLLIGKAFGKESPVKALSDTIYLDVQMPKGTRLVIPQADADRRELGVYLAGGKVTVEGDDVEERALMVGRLGANLTIEAKATSRVMILGGEPFGETREIWWNFVSSSKERIEKAKADWSAGRFPKVPGDDQEFIPLPDSPPTKKPAGTIL